MSFVAEALNLSPSAARRLEERNILREALIPHDFFSDVLDAFKLDKKFGEFEEGTVIAKTTDGVEIVRGYPKIRRALTLYPTIKRHFRDKVAIEEKMNGYNARLVLFGENIYAITRRGFFCPYTTEKARDLINDSFFKDHPELILCGEAVGSESPFVVKETYGKGIDFFVFDIREKRTNKPMTIEFKERASKEYGFKIAPIL
ncbi:RNA ligase, partial [Archaeoglobales archaeon]